MKIFVTVGTQEQKFERLFAMLDQVNFSDNDEVIVQCGSYEYQNSKFQVSSLIDNFDQVLKESDLVICHGGVGTIISALKLNKKVIAVARLAEYDEHVNNHQIEIVGKYVDESYILSASNAEELQEAIDKIGDFKPQKFKSNTESFVSELNQIIGELC